MRTGWMSGILLTGAVALLLAGVIACDSETSKEGPETGKGDNSGAPGGGRQEISGALLFQNNCAVCHGEKGRGDGVAAEFVFPRPRDLTSGMYKIRSTPSGKLPTDQDILEIITRGIPGSSMPSFEFLSKRERGALVEYVKELAVVERPGGGKANLFEVRGQGKPINVPEPPEKTAALVREGKQIYEKMNCAACHGETGVGDGPSADSLVDVWGMPAPPANFTRGIFKGGNDVSEIYARFTTGMDGSPMPSYADSLSDEERWALAYYVQSLVKKPRALAHKSMIEIPCTRADTAPLDPQDAGWEGVPATEIPVMMLWQKEKGPNYVDVRVIRSADHLAMRLEWEDPTTDGTQLKHTGASDAAAVMYSLTEQPGPITMGSAEQPVNLWQWRFSRQLDAKLFRDIESAYPNMAVDDYPEAESHYPKEAPAHTPVSPAPKHNKTYLSGWGAGNPLSNPNPPTAAEDLNAEGLGTLASQDPDGQDVEAKGVWDNGRWRVVIRRPLQSKGNDVRFKAGTRIPVAFGLWDGDAMDRDGQKSVSYWHLLMVE